MVHCVYVECCIDSCWKTPNKEYGYYTSCQLNDFNDSYNEILEFLNNRNSPSVLEIVLTSAISIRQVALLV